MSFSSVHSVSPEELPTLLRRATAGDHHARDDVVSILYKELHKFARAYHGKWRKNQSDLRDARDWMARSAVSVFGIGR